MEISVSYKYSELDKRQEFGIEILEVKGWDQYINWVYFYLGAHFIEYSAIHPYKVGKVIKVYKNCNDARRQAKLIINKIEKIKQNPNT